MIKKTIYLFSILAVIILSCKSSDVEPKLTIMVTGLSCGSTTFSSTATAGTPYSAIAKVGYTGGNGATYEVGTAIASKGVTGLSATLTAGSIATGAGTLTLAVNGNPSAAGVATYAFTFGGQSCTINQTVLAKGL